MLKDPSLGLNLTIIGGITSLLPVAYAFSKGISGFLGSTMSPRLLLSFGLASTGFACLAFGMGSHPTWFAFFWAINGLLQVRIQLSVESSRAAAGNRSHRRVKRNDARRYVSVGSACEEQMVGMYTCVGFVWSATLR
jgi:hypothetical protein